MWRGVGLGGRGRRGGRGLERLGLRDDVCGDEERECVFDGVVRLFVVVLMCRLRGRLWRGERRGVVDVGGLLRVVRVWA